MVQEYLQGRCLRNNYILDGRDLEKVEKELSVTKLGKRLMERGENKKVIEIVKNSIKNGLDKVLLFAGWSTFFFVYGAIH